LKTVRKSGSFVFIHQFCIKGENSALSRHPIKIACIQHILL